MLAKSVSCATVVDVLRQLVGDRLGSLESSGIGRVFEGLQNKIQTWFPTGCLIGLNLK